MQSTPLSPSLGRRLTALFVAFILTIQTLPAFAGVYYIHSDHLDTPRVVTNQQNQIVWQNPPLTEPFGSGAPDEDPDGDATPFTLNLRFPGQYFDQEINAHYNYYRDHYFPSLGRYGQSDPIGLLGGVNTYGYVNGSPLIYVDPSGELLTVPLVLGCVLISSTVFFVYKYYKFVKCVEQCVSCPNNPTGEFDTKCTPLKDDGNTNPNYVCKTYCTLSSFPPGARGKGAAGSNNYP